MAAPVYIDAKGNFAPEALSTSPSARLLTAASIAMYAIKRSKAHTWAELGRDLSNMAPDVLLEPWQVELLVENDTVLQVLSVRQTGDPEHVLAVTVAACTTCHGWLAVAGTASVPAKCTLLVNCGGELVKATAGGPRPPARLLTDKQAAKAAA